MHYAEVKRAKLCAIAAIFKALPMAADLSGLIDAACDLLHDPLSPHSAVHPRYRFTAEADGFA